MNTNRITYMKHFRLIPLLAAALFSVGLATSSSAHDDKNYPLHTCVVSGDKLGEMGKPVKVTHDGTEVQLCCKACIKDFNKDPAKYVKIVKDAHKK
jgi:hypothetical protein